jgi:hypothetical protein
MASNDRGVPRGDHAAGEQDKADSVNRQEANTRGEGIAADAASKKDPRGGDSPATPTPDVANGSDRGGSGSWGAAPAGGSVIDKRGPEKQQGE